MRGNHHPALQRSRSSPAFQGSFWRLAIADTRRGVVRLPDVLPAANIVVAVRCMAAARSGGLSVVQLFTQRNRAQDWPRANHYAMANADGAGIVSARDWALDDSA